MTSRFSLHLSFIAPHIYLLAVLLLTSCATTKPQGDLVARHDGGIITAEDVALFSELQGYNYRDPWAAFQHAPDLEHRVDADYFLNVAVEEILLDRTLAEQARAARFRPESLPEQAQLDASVHGCLQSRWLAEAADSFTTATLEEQRDILAQLRFQFESPERRDVSYIFLSDTGAATGEFLRNLRQRILSGEITFADAAFRHSEAPSSTRRGSIGSVPRDSAMKPGFVELIFRTGEGGISEPVLLDNGWYMVHVRGIVPERTLGDEPTALAQFASSIESSARDRHVARRIAQLRESLGAPEGTPLPQLLQLAGYEHPDCELMRALGEQRLLGQAWLMSQIEDTLEPTREEMETWAANNPGAMYPDGQFRLSRYVVPLSREANLLSREQALALASDMRDRLAEAGGDEAVLEGFLRDGRLTIESTPAFVMSSGMGNPIDNQLLRMNPGDLTTAIESPEGAVFFRLDDRRSLDPVPVEERADFIRENLRNRKMWDAREERKRAAIASHGLRRLWERPEMP